MTPQMFDTFEAERARAEAEGQPVEIDYNGVALMLKPHGGMGYRFNASGGRFGATWSFKKPNGKDPWGVRVNFGSDFLAHFGLGEATAHLDKVLDKFGIRYAESDVSIARADYCIDMLAPSFELMPDQFVMHSSTGRRDFLLEADKSVHGRSGRVTSVTVGSVRNRQVIIYDKREEVIKRGKVHWWDIWNDALRRQDMPLMNPEDASTSRVWRVEIRAGKDLLKDRWNIRTFRDFFDRFGDAMVQAVNVIRYTQPCDHDSNRARWPNHAIWGLVMQEVANAHSDMRTFADPDRTKEVNRAQHISDILRNILGCSVTLAALQDSEFSELSGFFQNTAEEMSGMIRKRPEKYAKMLDDAKARYRFR